MTTQIVFYAFFLVALFLYFSNKPRLLLLLTIAFTPIISLLWNFKIYQFSLVDIAFGWILIILVSALIKKILSGTFYKGKYFLPYVVFYSYTLFSLAINFNPPYVLDYLQVVFQLSVGLITYLSVLNFFNYEDRWNILKAIWIAILITLSLVAFQLLTGTGTQHSQYSYLTGLYHNEGFLTRMAIIGIIINLPLRNNRIWKKNKILSTLFLFGCILTLGLSISRNAVLAAAAILLLFVILKKRFVWFFAIVLVGISIYSFVGVVQSGYEAKLKKEITYLEGGKINSFSLGSGRVGRWSRTWENFVDADIEHKLFGTGRGIGPHGQLFDTLRRNGIFGVGVTLYLFFGISLFAFRHVRRDAKDPFALFGLLIIVAYWTLFIAASPIFETTVQLLLFAFVAILEKKEIYLVKLKYYFLKKSSGFESAIAP